MIVWVPDPFFLLDKIAVCNIISGGVSVQCRKIRNIDMQTTFFTGKLTSLVTTCSKYILSDMYVGICMFFTKMGLMLLIILFCNLPFHQKCIYCKCLSMTIVNL